MNDRKLRVVKIAHKLFIEKGYQATSIQDILDESGISKGTFYNYFSSKNELLVEIFNSTHKKLEKEREALLIGKDRSDIEIFIKQVELQMRANRESRLISLFEEVLASNDSELKKHIEMERLNNIRWIYERFLDIFGDDKKSYLLDASIMFLGIIRENIKFYKLANGLNFSNIERVVRYSVNRMIKMVDGLAESGEQLLQPEQLDNWLPNKKNCNQAFYKVLHQTVSALKNAFYQHEEQAKYVELLDFILEELMDSKHPRQFLIESALLSLKGGEIFIDSKELEKLYQIVKNYFTSLNDL